LWSIGALTYDVSKKHNFFMKVALIWTFSDFPAYEMVYGWNTHGKLVCSYCKENSKAFTLTNDSKTSFFNCHKWFLPMDHKYRKNRKDFFIGKVERDVVPQLFLGEELYDVMS